MLTPDEARDRACAAIERAIKAGADAADAALSTDAALSVSVRLGALEEVERSEGADLSLRVFIGQRSASVSTGELDDGALDDLAQRAVRMAREASEDRWAGLAPEERLLNGAPPALDLDDGAEVDPEMLKADALAAEAAARGVEGVTNSEGGGASASRVVIALATSHGFAGAYALTSHSLSASVLAGTGEGMERDYAHHSARHRKHLESPEAVGRRAGARTVAKLNPARIGSGAMPIIFDPRIAPGLLGAFTGAISGGRIARRTSFLQDMLGKQVFAHGITVLDDPHRPHGLRSRPFDGEGLPTSPVTIVENGMLETWLLDSASARQLGLEPTGHGSHGGGVATSNLYIAAGTASPQALIGDIENGLWVTELIGQGVNPVTGDYSRGASGFLIEGGEITRPVAEITIAGNLKDMFRNMTPANDLEFRYGVNTPTLRVDGMTVAGD
ncbi:TldD/PmbA family protein [Stakelama sp. CBK3Z-3]|uniref:TldD/PmbA family protein n=1 Tax=Stakelama flava TaxID=2860338 RepID=A0ABS6XP82_9SPHN|nr:metallopeptidase TldD-related protein [Stakelama flava]MBW4332028.1 TldD/PmbA family protein [Stakelama flava]